MTALVVMLACTPRAGSRPPGLFDTGPTTSPHAATTLDTASPSRDSSAPPTASSAATAGVPADAEPPLVGDVASWVVHGGRLTADGCVLEQDLTLLVQSASAPVELGLEDPERVLESLATPGARAEIVADCLSLLESASLSGLHITPLPPEAPRALTLAVNDLRIALEATGRRLTVVAVDGVEPELAMSASRLVLPLYDELTPGLADHHASLQSASARLDTWLAVTTADRLALGWARHGWQWSGVPAPTPPSSTDGAAPARLDAAAVAALRGTAGWVEGRDDEGAWLHHEDGRWVSADDDATLAARVALASEAAVSVHWLDWTDDDGSLTTRRDW